MSDYRAAEAEVIIKNDEHDIPPYGKGSIKLALAPGIEQVLLSGFLRQFKLHHSFPHVAYLVWSHGDSTAMGLEGMSFHEFGSAVFVDFSVMIITSLLPLLDWISGTQHLVLSVTGGML